MLIRKSLQTIFREISSGRARRLAPAVPRISVHETRLSLHSFAKLNSNRVQASRKRNQCQVVNVINWRQSMILVIHPIESEKAQVGFSGIALENLANDIIYCFCMWQVALKAMTYCTCSQT